MRRSDVMIASDNDCAARAGGGALQMGIDTDAVGRPCAVSSRLQTILGETEAALRGIYGDRFLGLVLFGSHARGTAGSVPCQHTRGGHMCVGREAPFNIGYFGRDAL